MSTFFLLSFSSVAFAQNDKQVEIEQANSLEGVKINGVEIRRLTGDVIFKQGDTRLFCDSALFNEAENTIDAYGSVRIENLRARLSGEVLNYQGNEKIAVITGKVVRMTDGKMTLTTDRIRYDLAQDIGTYDTGGKVVDNANVLTSRKGYYYAKEQAVYFREKVLLNNPRYTLSSDTLRYHTPSETAYFLGPTELNSLASDSGYIFCYYGWYNTKSEKCYFSKNAFIQSKETTLRGDSILYDRKSGVGQAWKNVSVTDTINKMIVSGDYARLDEKKNTSFVTGTSMLTKVFETDSLFLHADTLYAQQDTATKSKTYLAYKHVRLFKPDFQGQCDSLVYRSADSTITFYGMPILWNNKNQLTGDLVVLQLANNKMHSLLMRENAFISGQEDTLRFNQVKGRDMTGFFTDNKLSSIEVKGNGQTIYYIRNGKKQLTGVNKADCSDMWIDVEGNAVKKITLRKQPDATLFPITELPPLELRLKNFAWYGDKRPITKEEIFFWR